MGFPGQEHYTLTFTLLGEDCTLNDLFTRRTEHEQACTRVPLTPSVPFLLWSRSMSLLHHWNKLAMSTDCMLTPNVKGYGNPRWWRGLRSGLNLNPSHYKSTTKTQKSTGYNRTLISSQTCPRLFAFCIYRDYIDNICAFVLDSASQCLIEGLCNVYNNQALKSLNFWLLLFICPNQSQLNMTTTKYIFENALELRIHNTSFFSKK